MLDIFLTHYSFLSAHLSFLFTLKLTHSALLSSTPYLGDGSYLPSYLCPFTVLPISSYLHIFISSHPTQHPNCTTPTTSIVNKLTFRHTYLNLLDPKSKQDKVKVTNLKNLPKLQIFEFRMKQTYTPHTFCSCLIRCVNMKWIRQVL